jgi:hypothetical protein
MLKIFGKPASTELCLARWKKNATSEYQNFDILFNFIIKQEKYFCQIQQYIEEKLDQQR